MQMNEPLPSQVRSKAAPTQAQLDMEGQSFMALMQQVKGA